MIKTVGRNIAVLSLRKSTIYTLSLMIALAALFYIYFAHMTVRTLTALEKSKSEMQSLSIKVSDMESKRLAVETNISIEKALQAGFVEVSNPTFIIKGKNTALSLKMD
ncbi:MAG: hypothetical protein GX627_01000 [Parcubacteria group bacterium]|jgi:hypothetical protein|nr:hypothetical protein [Parcubacteria group bacterium]